VSQGNGRLGFVQGLAVRPGSGQVYATEHGTFRDDEVILLRPGGNGGWNPVGNGGYDESVPMTDPALPDVMLPSWASGDPTIATSEWTFLAGPHSGDVDGACSWVRPCQAASSYRLKS
jgi:aldose sugar dehydrogenase